jgi:hypothetical protein
LTEQNTDGEDSDQAKKTMALWLGGLLGGGALGAAVGLAVSAMFLIIIAACVVGLIFWICA